jgi:hypothetical protein
MPVMETHPSPALIEANRQLLEQRQRLQTASRPAEQGSGEEKRPVGLEPAFLPAHLGWGSARLTAILRRRQKQAVEQQPIAETQSRPTWTTPTNMQVPVPPRPEGMGVKLYPDIGLAMLREGAAAAGRLWLLLRFLDEEGRGNVRIVHAQEQLTRKNSLIRLCGRKQLQNLLRDGEGIFWKQENGRLWLQSADKAAAALGVERLTGRPVILPVTVLLRGMKQFKAHLYADFHSGRKKQNPISRAAQARRTGVPERTQRHYCRVAKVRRQQNIAVEQRYSQEGLQEAAWQRGGGVFEFKDSQGKQGPKDGRYLAHQMPATHTGPHETAARGRQRKINRKLKDLVNERARGNGSEKVDRLYHPHGSAAAKSYNGDPDRDAYWPITATKSGRIWGVIEMRP